MKDEFQSTVRFGVLNLIFLIIKKKSQNLPKMLSADSKGRVKTTVENSDLRRFFKINILCLCQTELCLNDEPVVQETNSLR